MTALADRYWLPVWLFLLLFWVDAANALSVKKARLQKQPNAHLLVIDGDGSLKYRIRTNKAGRDFSVIIDNVDSSIDFGRIQTGNSHISRLSGTIKQKQLSLRILTRRPVSLTGNILLMPKGQGERLILRLTAKSIGARGSIDDVGFYAVELERSASVYRGTLHTSPLVSEHHLYSVALKSSGRERFSLRLGFFENSRAALAKARQFRQLFPKLRVVKVSTRERNNFADRTKVAAKQKRLKDEEDISNRIEREQQRQVEEEPDRMSRYERLMEEARQAMAGKQYPRAIALYSKVASESGGQEQQLAQEYLAVAYERSGRSSRAIAEYEKYIKLYPDTEGAQRMQQRLAAISSLNLNARNLRSSSRVAGGLGKRWNTYGSVMQTYRTATFTNDSGVSRDAMSALDSYINAYSKYRADSYDVDAKLSAGYFYDLLDDDRFISQESFARVSYLSVRGKHRSSGHQVRVGRQRSPRGGVLGRYDGAELTFKLKDWLTVNGVTGLGVDRANQTFFDNDRTFYGVNVDLHYLSDFDTNVFFIEQSLSGGTDRRAVGGDIRYATDRISAYTKVDYDIFFAALNAVLFNAGYVTDNKIHVNAGFEHRKSPYLSSRNALIGEPSVVRQELTNAIEQGQSIEDIVLDKTYESNIVRANATLPLGKKYSIYTHLSWATLSNANGLESVADPNQVEVDETETRLGAQLIGKDFILDGATVTLGYDLILLDDASVNSLLFDMRYRLSDNFMLRPRLNLRFRSQDSGTEHRAINPGLMLQYRLFKRLYLDFELNWHFYNDTIELTDNEATTVSFIYAGYRYVF